jgi:tRNA dimethylallyltransferase
MKKPLLINITGPTASGKTEIAIHVAQALDTEILSADSRQIYKEMRIGTAVPSDEELQKVKHHFIRHISIFDTYTASDFEKEALEKINELAGSKPYIVMAGGTGLYFNAVNYGLDEIPGVPETIRSELNRLLEEKGIAYLQRELREKDPGYYQTVDKHNPRRLLRALEVIRHTGKPYSSFRSGKAKKRPFDTVWFGLLWPRQTLYERINRRVDLMMEKGLLDEAEQWYPYRNLNALQTVGYRELFDYLDGKIPLSVAVEEIKKNTRRYAKRQMTWFKKNPEIRWLDMTEGNVAEKIIREVEKRKK